MKNLICLLLATFSFSTAMAKDSTWMMCVGDTDLFGDQAKLAVNVFEHRQGRESRATDLTLIYGGHVLQGVLDSTDSDSGTVSLKQNKSSYSGFAGVDYATHTLSLNGQLTLHDMTTPVVTKLQCEVLGD